MRRCAAVLLASAFFVVVMVTMAKPAAADNCDIFINAEDCQNTGWTVGIIATLAGGVAVATAATLASRPQEQMSDDEQQFVAGMGVRAMFTSPTTEVEPSSGVVNAHAVRVVAHSDQGRQTVREARHGPA
jgi:hypothetical protein